MWNMFGKKQPSPAKGLAGKGFLILNALRVCNIIVLLTVIAASWIMLVMTVKTSSFFFFDGVSHFITSSIGVFLIISECGFFTNYFAKNWPLLSATNGFLFLGLTMIGVGFNILGNLNKAATSVDKLGLPMWRVVISSGILAPFFGFINIVFTYVFRNAAQSARQVRRDGASTLPLSQNPLERAYSVSSSSTRDFKLPGYDTTPPVTQQRSSRLGNRLSKLGFKFPITISKPIPQQQDDVEKWPTPVSSRASPILPRMERPPTALHPAWKHDPESYPRPPPIPSSRYSISSMSQYSQATAYPI